MTSDTVLSHDAAEDEPVLSHDASVSAFHDAGGVVETHDDGTVESFDFGDEESENVVRIDAPSNLTGAFDSDRFYKITDATIARPIKQAYLRDGEIKWYKKPAEELDRAAWTFDNVPYTLDHPDTGMVKRVDDVHGFWRNPYYDHDQDRLKADLYIPFNDDEAVEYIQENQDVSVGFYNRIYSDYDGNTGSISDDEDLDGFQVDIFGNHIAGVKRGRCSKEDGCGLDDQDHGIVITDENMMDDVEYEIIPSFDGEFTTDYRNSEDRYFAVSPSENSDDEPKYPINNCSDVSDAWKLRSHGNIDISVATLEDRIKRRARELDCRVPGESMRDNAVDCGCGTDNDNKDNTTMSDEDTQDTEDGGFEIPDLSVEAIADKNESIKEIVEERDSYKEQYDETRSEIEEALDGAENFTVSIEEDECICDAVEQIVADLDQKVEEVEKLGDELAEYREDEIEERLDELEELGADREDWADEVDDADDPLDALDEEIERRKEVLESASDTSVKGIDSSSDSEDETTDDDVDRTWGGTRTFGRGHKA